jgi:hypothetical protein
VTRLALPPRAILRNGALALLALGGLRCSDSTGPSGAVGVTLAVDATVAAPGDVVSGTVTVAAGRTRIDYIGVRASGLAADAESTLVDASGTQAIGFSLQIPSQPPHGVLDLVGTARHGTAVDTSSTVAIAVKDTIPPVVAQVGFAPDSVEPNTLLRVAYEATDNAGIAKVVVRLSGAFTASDTIVYASFPRAPRDTLRRQLPRTVVPGSVLTVQVEAIDLAGLTTTRSLAPITITDITAPLVSGTTNIGGDLSNPLVVNDTLRVTVNASDNYQTAWVGYFTGSPANFRDSVAVTAADASHVFAHVVPPSWVGNQALLFFARDWRGQFNATLSDANLYVFDADRRPIRTGPALGPVRDLAYDAKRNLLYLTQQGVSAITVVKLSNLTFAAAIATPFVPAGMDLSVGGDTLVVAFRRSPYLGIVDLTQPTAHVDTVRLAFDSGGGRGPDFVRVAANGKVLVTIASDSGGTVNNEAHGRMWTYDLATGAQGVRADAGATGMIAGNALLTRSTDRTRVFLMPPVDCCSIAAQVYGSAGDTFGPPRPTAGTPPERLSADSAGAVVLVDHTTYDANLAFIANRGLDFYNGGPTVVAPGGTIAYYGEDPGYIPQTYAKVRLSDGAVLEKTLVRPTYGSRFWLSADGLSLIITSDSLRVVDLR